MKKIALRMLVAIFVFTFGHSTEATAQPANATDSRKFEEIFDQKPEINLYKMTRTPEEFEELMIEEELDEEDLRFEWTQSYQRLVEEYKDRTECRPEDGVLTENECVALFVYTTQYFYMINTILRHGDEKDIQVVQPIISMLSSALGKLPAYNGVVYRGIRESEDHLEFLDKYIKGRYVTEDAFLSTTNDSKSAYLGSSIKMIIKSINGRDISVLGGHEGEFEVLFDKGTTFLVTDTYSKNDQEIIEMTEVSN